MERKKLRSRTWYTVIIIIAVIIGLGLFNFFNIWIPETQPIIVDSNNNLDNKHTDKEPSQIEKEKMYTLVISEYLDALTRTLEKINDTTANGDLTDEATKAYLKDRKEEIDGYYQSVKELKNLDVIDKEKHELLVKSLQSYKEFATIVDNEIQGKTSDDTNEATKKYNEGIDYYNRYLEWFYQLEPCCI